MSGPLIENAPRPDSGAAEELKTRIGLIAKINTDIGTAVRQLAKDSRQREAGLDNVAGFRVDYLAPALKPPAYRATHTAETLIPGSIEGDSLPSVELEFTFSSGTADDGTPIFTRTTEVGDSASKIRIGEKVLGSNAIKDLGDVVASPPLYAQKLYGLTRLTEDELIKYREQMDLLRQRKASLARN